MNKAWIIAGLASVSAVSVLAQPQTSPSGCWGWYKGLLNDCAGAGETAEARAQCYAAAALLLRECLDQVPVEPKPTQKQCWLQFFKDLKDCEATWRTNVPGTTAFEQRSACLKAAFTKHSWCFDRVPKPRITMALSDSTIVPVSASVITISVTASEGKIFGGLAWFLVEANNADGYTPFLSSALPTIGLGETVSVKLEVPDEVRNATGNITLVLQGMTSSEDIGYSAVAASSV